MTILLLLLQVDCLSPLLFNLCFNTFLQHIKSEKYRQFGFSLKFLNPIHWFQFADDAAVISGQESENQHLIDRFIIWCNWSKLCTKSVQYLPKLLINGVLIPCVEMGESFRYVGRFFDFNMSNNQHMSELSSLVQDLMNDIDIKPLHPKHKLLLYSRYVLSKLSWHFTIANISKTWITEHLDSVVNGYIRKWLDIPISGTLSNVFLERNIFGLNICPPSIKFTQCQTVLRNSPNDSLKDLWKSSSCHTNIQYVYKSTKEVLEDFRSNQEDKLQHHLTSQGFFFSNVIKYSLLSVNSIWSEAQSHLPKNIYNFTIRFINNSLPTRKNMARWGLSQSPDCSFCLNPESLLHVVAGCQQYLDRFTSWRHDSILNFIAKSLQPVINSFLNPSIITGENYRPDLLFLIQSKCLYVLELTVGFESNLNNNAVRKKEKYVSLINEMSGNYRCVRFVNLSMSSLGVFSDECSSFLDMMNDIGLDKKQQRYIIKKKTKMAIRATYYIFCCRNRNWDSPDLMPF